MKKKVLLSSILTIALCLSLIAGSTYALFTAKSEVNIAITAGKLDFTAGISITNLSSVEPQDGGSIVDEKGGTYEYTYTDDAEFLNGGTAAVTNGNTLTITNITPGDKIDVDISGDNKSNVDTRYRYIIECTNGYTLMHGLVVYVTTQDANGQDVVTAYESLAYYTSEWMFLEADEDFTHPITIELPVKAGNVYQDKSADIKITVEAVQGNAATTNERELVTCYIETPVVEPAVGGGHFGDTTAERWYKDMYLVDDGNVVVIDDTPVCLENVTADVDGSVIVINTANYPAILIQDCDFTLDAGEYIIDSTVATAYQVFLYNVTVNGELLPVGTCDPAIAEYFNNVAWYEVIDPVNVP